MTTIAIKHRTAGDALLSALDRITAPQPNNSKRFEQAAAKYGLRAVEFIQASEWVKDYPIAAADYSSDAKTAASLAASFAFYAHPNLREE